MPHQDHRPRETTIPLGPINRLRAMVQLIGWTTAELGQITHRNKSQISRILRGHSDPPLSVVAAILDACGGHWADLDDET